MSFCFRTILMAMENPGKVNREYCDEEIKEKVCFELIKAEPFLMDDINEENVFINDIKL